ncbi:hypothetical protein PUV44_09510 [Xanthomonas arboricola pv. corylina]|nr:hypothetical protein PUV44_09510 [Xanthomonas arboricola pv. corylina]
MVEIVRNVSSDDLPAVRRTRPLLIRQVLLWEFGQTFREHSEWTSIMRRIEAQLDANDPEGTPSPVWCAHCNARRSGT